MKLHYYPETDSLYIELKPVPGVETREIVSGVNVDLDAGGAVVGLDIEHASQTGLDFAGNHCASRTDGARGLALSIIPA